MGIISWGGGEEEKEQGKKYHYQANEIADVVTEFSMIFPVNFQKTCLPDLRRAFNLQFKKLTGEMGINNNSPKAHLLQLLISAVYCETFKQKYIPEIQFI